MTDNSAVKITINVVDAATGETTNRVNKNLDSVGEAGMRNGQKLKQGFQEVGHAGEGVGPAVGRGMKEAGAHSLTALDNVRLLRDDLGIRIPKAMEKVISQSVLAMGAIGAIGGGLVALGAIQVLVQLGEQAYKFYRRLTDVNVEMRKYAEQAGKSAAQKLFDTSSIEEVNALLRQTEASLGAIEKKRREAGVGNDNSGSIKQHFGTPFAAAGLAVTPNARDFGLPIPYTDADDRERAEKTAQQALLKESREAIEAKRSVALQETKAAEDGLRLTGRAATAAAERNAIVLAQLKQAQQLKEAVFQRDAIVSNNALIKSQHPGDKESDLRKAGYQDVPVVAPDLGAQDAADAITKARGEAGAKNSKQSIDEMREADHATAEARMAGMDGEALYLAKEQEELRQLAEKAHEVGMASSAYQAMRSAIEQKYFQEQTKRMREEDARSAELEAGANVGGLSGLAKLDAERDAKLRKLQDEAGAGKFTNVDTLDRNTAATNKQHDNEAGQQQQTFTDRIAELDAGRADRYASESDRITQSADKTVREIQKAWAEMYGQLAPLDARRVQSQQALNAEIVKINADAARQRGEADQRMEDQTRKLEDEAGRMGLPKYQQQTAAIVDEYKERYRLLEEERKKFGANDQANRDRIDRQELADHQIMNGKLAEQQRELADTLAGHLKGLIGSHPLDALKGIGEDQAAKYAAQQLMIHFPHVTAGVAGSLGKGGSALPNIPGWGGKHPAHADPGASQAGSGTHNDNPLAATLGKPQISAGETTLTTATATINVGSATFTGVGGATGGGATRGGAGTYVPTGNGGYFNLGAGSNSGGFGGDAGLPGSSAGSPSIDAGGSAPAGGVYSEAGAAASVGDRVEAGASTAQTVGADAKSISDSLGIKKDAGQDAGQGGGFAGKLGGEAGAALGVFSAVEGKGGFGGALSGAVSGAKLGAEVGGPIGAAVGALAGAGLGLLGLGARSQAEKYNTRTVKPRVANDLIAYEAGQMDYQSAYDDMTHLITEAKVQTRQMGSSALSYYNSTIDPEIKQAQERLTREQKAGRSEFGMSAGQFHQGGLIRDFGTMATSPDEGWVHAQRNEMMLNQQAAMTHADAAMLMNSGASRSQMAEYYGGGAGTRQADSSGASEVHLHVHAIDTRGVKQFFDDNKHTLRDSLNASYADNSGGGDYA